MEEAQGYVDKGWGHRWEEVLPVLKRLAGEQAEEEGSNPKLKPVRRCGKALLNEDQLRQLFDGEGIGNELKTSANRPTTNGPRLPRILADTLAKFDAMPTKSKASING